MYFLEKLQSSVAIYGDLGPPIAMHLRQISIDENLISFHITDRII